MDIQIEITTNDNALLDDVMEAKASHPGTVKSVLADVTLRLDSHIVREAFGSQEILQFTLSISRDNAVAIFSAWLYDKLQGRATKLEISRIDVKVDKEEMARFLSERLKRSRQ